MSKTKQEIVNNNCLSDYHQDQTNGYSYWKPHKTPGKTDPITPKSTEIKPAKQITPHNLYNLFQPPKTPQSKSLQKTPLTAKSTPNYRPRSCYRRNLFQSSTPESPLLKNHPPVLSSTVFSPMKKNSSKFSWGENIYCYHCGNTVNLTQSGRIMEHLSKLSVEDIGRTVFDLEKLSDTGMASKCVYSVENVNNHSNEAIDFLTAMSKSKTLPTKGQLTPNTVAEEQTNINTSKLPESLDDILYSVTDNDSENFKPLLSLDIFDVEEMLKLLETSSDDTAVNCKEPEKPTYTVSTTSVQDKSLSPIPMRQLRPRKKL